MARLLRATLFSAVIVIAWTSTIITVSSQAGNLDAASTHYDVLPSVPSTGQERVLCLARGSCLYNVLTCPAECPNRKPKRNKVDKGCFIDCSSRCETTCKTRLPNCNGYGSVCYDPRFVGGDGVMFYFHGATGSDFALVSDDLLQINGHFIGTRPEGRDRDFTWVQGLSVMFDSHILAVASKKVAKWRKENDAITVSWDGEYIELPADAEAEWKTTTTTNPNHAVTVERTSDTNSVRVTVENMLEMDLKVTPITEEEDRVHGYHLPEGDSFAHLEMQFKFKNLTDQVEGVLGKTYRPGYVSPVKRGVPMPIMGGEDRYILSSLFSYDCVSCRFRPSSPLYNNHQTDLLAVN